jgi:hypothetical protein
MHQHERNSGRIHDVVIRGGIGGHCDWSSLVSVRFRLFYHRFY